jgi:hypothetical protein
MYEDFEKVSEAIKVEEQAEGVSKDHLLLD